MAFKDLREVITGRTLTLPIGGKSYVIQNVDADTGLWVQQLVELGMQAADSSDASVRLAAVLGDAEERQLHQRVLGATFDELVADGVTLEEMRHIGSTVVAWLMYGEQIAELYWAGDLDGDDDQGEAGAPDTKGSRPASGAAATTTRTRASGSTTRGSKKRKGRGPRPGRTSSPNGNS